MTWLFTQVWLWSSASFVVGSLLTWLLFVRPLRKKLRWAEEQLLHEVEEAEHRESTALDLFPAKPEDEPAIGDWERRPRPSLRPPEPTPETTRVSGTDRPERAIPDWTDDDGDTREVGQFLPLRPEPPARETPVRPRAEEEPEPRLPMLVQATPRPESLPEPETVERAVSGEGSTWFQKPEIDEHEWSDEPAPVAEPKPELPAVPSSSLQSLFEPLGTPDPDAVRVDALSLEATQNIPRIEEPPADAEKSPLPRRTPGAGPRPGLQNLGEAAAARVRQHEEQGNEQEKPSPEPDEGYTIKGHFASRQYHTPDSPQYERVAAEVWFRTTEDAEQAGFEAWNARN